MDGGGIYVTLYMISSSAFPIVYTNKLSVSIVQLKLQLKHRLSANHWLIACVLCVTNKNLYSGSIL